MDQLATEAHDHQQHRIAGAADALVGQLHLAQLDLEGRHLHIAALAGQHRPAAQEQGQKN
ncbi:hypothetical protein D3C80_1850090 [compost metagenome]